ncbi:MAG TPA: biopolymer transporter ExbD [Phototrophicaceae bacterium]|jgi:biopolymer transport protein ExbD|nr:biopolymer transporter ExbD [Phototrophicaceae bacterium]
MSMAVGPASGDADVMVEMNTTPLIDVMLVLLVMLIVTIPIQTHAVKLDLPQANQSTPPSDVKPVVVDLEIDFDGTAIWNGSPVASRAQLDKYLEDTANQVPQPEVHLRPNRLAKYDVVARTLADAQRLGVTKIGFVGTEQYVE